MFANLRNTMTDCANVVVARSGRVLSNHPNGMGTVPSFRFASYQRYRVSVHGEMDARNALALSWTTKRIARIARIHCATTVPRGGR